MKQDAFTRLQQVATLKYQRDQRSFAEQAQRETDLRLKIKQLNDHEKSTNLTVPAVDPFARSGAILPWQSWVAKSRNQLNIELAQVLARKESLRGALQKSFGQKEALAALQRKEAAAKKRQAASRLLD